MDEKLSDEVRATLVLAAVQVAAAQGRFVVGGEATVSDALDALHAGMEAVLGTFNRVDLVARSVRKDKA